MKLTKYPAKAKNEARKAKEERRESEKKKSRDFAFYRFSSLLNSLEMIKKLLDYKLQNAFFGKISRGEWVNHLQVKSGSKNMIVLIAC